MDHASVLARELVDLTSLLKRLMREELRAAAAGASPAPTLTQYRMLRQIQAGQCQVTMLSEAFGITQPATSIMVETMVKQGFLTRARHPTDRRRIELHLTELATTSLERNYRRALATIDRRLARLPAAAQQALAAQLHTLVEVLGAGEDSADG